MENPQKEDGFIPMANEIAEALMQTQVNGYQNRLLWAVWRKTWGFNKKEDWISNSQLVSMTGLHKAHICRAIKQLVDRKIVTKNGNKIQFNKFYSQWRELPKMVTVTKNGNTVTKNGNRELPKMADTINTLTKDNITKDNESEVKTKQKRKKINGEVYRGKDMQFDVFLNYCQKMKISPEISPKQYFELEDEYKVRVMWWSEVRGCVDWLHDNNLKNINIQRLRNRMKNAIRFAKEREIKRMQEYQDKKFQPPQKKISNQSSIWTPPL